MVPDKVGKRLKKLRELAGVSQAALAFHLGFDQAYLSQMEHGFRPISQEVLNKAEAFLRLEYSRRDREFAAYLEPAIA